MVRRLVSAGGKRLRMISVFIVVFLLCVGVNIGGAQATKIDLNALIQETQKMSQNVDEMTLIWWIPEEYWQASFAQDPTITDAQAEEFIKVLRPYVVIVAIDGKIGPFGGVTYKSEATVRNNIKLVSKGVSYRPLSDEKVNADTQNLISSMKPALANMLGPMGRNMHFFLFPAKDKKGQNIAEATKEGSFTVKLGLNEFKWRLPLGSLLPPKTCPVDGEQMSGAWKFCPWHGVRLIKSK